MFELGALTKSDLVIISDVHIKTESENTALVFEELLKSFKTKRIKTLILLGDIFDFCFGASDYFRNKYRQIGEVLSDLADSGTEVIFVEGNHEFAMSKIGWNNVRFVKFGSVTRYLENGRSVIAQHGDMFFPTLRYRLFRRVSKSFLIVNIVRLMPCKWLDILALSLSSKSRSYDKHREVDLNKLQRIAELPNFKNITSEHIVFGHLHTKFYFQSRASKCCQHSNVRFLYGLANWSTPNFLAFKNQDAIFFEYDQSSRNWLTNVCEK